MRIAISFSSLFLLVFLGQFLFSGYFYFSIFLFFHFYIGRLYLFIVGVRL